MKYNFIVSNYDELGNDNDFLILLNLTLLLFTDVLISVIIIIIIYWLEINGMELNWVEHKAFQCIIGVATFHSSNFIKSLFVKQQ